MSAGDSFIKLIQDVQRGNLQDDTDPNNIVLQYTASPFDKVAAGNESVRTLSGKTWVWSDGTTYTATDIEGNSWTAPSCGWLWGGAALYDGFHRHNLSMWPLILPS